MILNNDNILWASIWVFGAILIGGRLDGVPCSKRLSLLLEQQTKQISRTGIGVVIASLSAYLRNGGTILGAFQDQAGHNFATHAITYARIREIVEKKSFNNETRAQVEAASYALYVSCRLSTVLGCEASRCIDAVGAVHRRIDRLERLKATAFAMPKATVKLLMALPALTLAFGTLLGAHPLAFLVTSEAGVICLCIGVVFYTMGWCWIRALLRDVNGKLKG